MAIVLSVFFSWMFDAVKEIFFFKYIQNCLRVPTGTQFYWWHKSYSPNIFKNLIQRNKILNSKITYSSDHFIQLCSSLAGGDWPQFSHRHKKSLLAQILFVVADKLELQTPKSLKPAVALCWKLSLSGRVLLRCKW